MPRCLLQLIFAGESAGGTLSLLHVQNALAAALPVPFACIALSCWADFTCSLPSHTANGSSDLMMTKRDLQWCIAACHGGQQRMHDQHIDLSSSSFSPLQRSFAGFCPTYVVAGGAELLTSDSEAVYAACKAAGVDVTLRIGPHMV